MPDYPGAIWSPNRNFDAGPTAKDHIVIHGTAGGNSAEAIAQFFRSRENTNSPVSTQYIIDQGGVVAQTVLERDICYGNGNYEMNKRGIAIEHVKSATDNSSLLTPAQEEASFKLILDIRTRHNIPLENIIPHSAVVATACPGPYPFDRMRNYLEGGSMSTTTVPKGWFDDPKKGELRGPDKKVPVVLGFRDFILDPGNKWDPNDWPVRPEYGANPVEHSNPDKGAGNAQEFRMSRLVFAEGKIYKSWLGLELVWYQGQYTKPLPPNIKDDIQTVIDAANKLKADLT